MNTRAILAAIASLACLTAPASAHVIVSSGFEASADGWLIVDLLIPEDANPPMTVNTTFAEWFSSGGDPGGYIQGFLGAKNWWCFLAPPAFLGDKKDAYGGYIQFQIRSTIVDLGPRPGIFLVGAGMTLSYQTAPPQPDWAYLVAALSPTGWRLNNWASGPEPTDAQMKAVLGSLEAIYITGEWTDAKISKADLDNVQLAGPPSEDLDLDGDVDEVDLAAMLDAWGPCARLCDADLDGDGQVDGKDLGLLLAGWSTCPYVGCPASEHGCYVQGAAGCADVTCCADVCQNDPMCCCAAWDAFCVTLASDQCAGCGNPTAGDCCSNHSEPYCNNEACCTMVCAGDSFCCQLAWDDVCANAAELLSECACSADDGK